MIDRRRWLSGLACLVCAGAPLKGRADAPTISIAAAIRDRLALPPVARGAFIQTKILTGFKHPLESQGLFILARDLGIQWQVTRPFASIMVITPTHVRMFRDGDSTAQEGPADAGARAVGATLMAVLSGDLDTLATHFHIEGQSVPGRPWQLVLSPQATALAQFVTRLELEGNLFVDLVRVFEASGDTTTIRFSGQTATSLAPAEALLFQ